MTRKDYILIAKAIRDARSDITEKEPIACHENMLDGAALTAEHIADVLARDNSRFDRSRFLQVCGVYSSHTAAVFSAGAL